MCAGGGFEIHLSPLCCWKGQETREHEGCIRAGHILKQERDPGRLGWPNSGHVTPGELGARGWGHGPL